jgi:amino acid adenylation domain-containing protein
MASVRQDICEENAFRCSWGQQSLWLVDQIAPGSPAYNIHAAVRSPFPLDPAQLSHAAAALTARHETLRTLFEWDGFEPVQRVVDCVPPCLRMVDLSALPPDEAERELAQLSHGDATMPFDLREAPLLRLGLVQMPGRRSVLLVTIHHIIADAWSLNILLRDVFELYLAKAGGRAARLPELPVQYADFSAWQRDLLDHGQTARLVEGWRDYLAGAGELTLPTDHPRGRDRAQEGAHHRFVLSAKLSEACRARSREFAVTAYALVTGCFAEVLHRYGGSDDFLIGMPTAGRSRADLENLIGYFVRTLVLRIELKGRPSFRELAGRIGGSIGEALALQDLPFEKVVELAEPDRDLSINPLFQVTSQYLANPLERASNGSLEVVDLHRGHANFDLTLDVWEENGVLAGRIEYARGLYEPETVARLAGHLATLLEAAVAQPDRPLAELDMLTAEERELILGPWSEGPQLHPEEGSLGALFAEVAAAHPGRPAIRDEAGGLTFAELQCEATALAERLVAAGVAPGEAVGVCLPRGRAQIVAVLAIVLAGAAYVALDPGWPDERIAGITAIAGITKALTGGEDKRWPELGLHPVAADGLPARGTALPSATAESIAYIAFTSGSTGEPKGVPATHRAVVRLMRCGPPIDFAPDDVMLAYAPLGFDASTVEIWCPLLGGACVAVAPSRPLSPHELADFLESAGVTKAWLTAGLFSQVSEARASTLARLRTVFTGGDVLSEPAARRVLRAGGTVVNGYGPTENTVFTCYSVMHGEQAIAGGIRIGRPVAGTRVYILDGEDRPVAVGIPGELVAGGAGVSPGYLGGQAGETRFTPDPIDRERGSVYRTGDLVRWTADGEIAFLGRRDRQVKVRGFRIEPGEIERAVLAEPHVRDCVVAVRGHDADNKSLAAFVVLADGAAADVAALRRGIAARLPVHALPSSIIPVAQMPLGKNGKVDVAALLAMPLPREEEIEPSGSLTELEDLVAETFAAVLGCESVPPERPFFDLGGHSLHATRVVTRLREALEIELPLQAIFESPSVRGLSSRIEELLLAEFDTSAEERAA